MNLERQNENIVKVSQTSPVSASLISALTGNVSLKYSDFVKELEKIFEEKNLEKKRKMKINLIQSRVSQLGTLIFHDHPKFLEQSKTHHKFISPKTSIKGGLVLNDVSIYEVFLDNLENTYKKRNSPDVGGIIMFCINYTLIEYFGNYSTGEKEEIKNKMFYEKFDNNGTAQINLNQLKGKGNSTSIEKSSVAHNLLKFMGINSFLKLSLNCKFDGDFGNSQYSFCCLSTTKGYYIYEPTHSIVHHDQEGNLKTVAPNLIEITKEQFEKLIDNQPVGIMTTIKEKVFIDGKYQDKNKKIIVYAS
ncbi:MAG: hypothetical protein V3575_00210 [Candidatus Absconditabacteria bacterium]